MLACGVLGAASAWERDPVNHYILDCANGCPQRAKEAAIGAPAGIATDAEGNVYFTSQHIAFRIARDGTLTRIAGTGEPGYAGDGAPAVSARLDIPSIYPDWYNDIASLETAAMAGGIAVDADGAVAIADGNNHRVRRVERDGMITTLRDAAGEPVRIDYVQGVAYDGAGGLYAGSIYGTIVRIGPDGDTDPVLEPGCVAGDDPPGTCGVSQMAVDAGGAIVFADGFCRIRRWSPDEGLETVAGGRWDANSLCGHTSDGVQALDARLSSLFGVAVDAAGQVYFTDITRHCVRKVDAAGILTTVAGTCKRVFHDPPWAPIVVPFEGDGGPATEARLWAPRGIAFDADGNLYIADTGHRRIRRVTPDGIITTIAGNGEPLPVNRTGEWVPTP